MPPLWKPPDLTALIAKYLAGDSLHKLAHTHGVDRTTITKCLHRAGIPTRDRRTAIQIMPSVKTTI